MKKIIFIVIDGLADKPIKEFGGKTPLEAAKTPNMDLMAKNGICGIVEPFKFSWEKHPASEAAHLGLFGYQNYFLGRGPYEAAGIGIKMKKGEVALRANFGTVGDNLGIIDRRAGRISETEKLVELLKNITISGIKFLVKKSYGHRAVVLLQGKGLSAKISDSDPHRISAKVLKIIPLDKSKEAKFTAEVLNKFLEKTHQILKESPFNKQREGQGKLPANYLLVRGAGQFRPTPSFKNRYGLKAACIAGGALYKGIAGILGMDIINVKGANGFSNTNLAGKIKTAKLALKKYDFIFLHIKATDSLAEDGNFQGKKDFIEKIDKNLKPFLFIKNALVIITADHATSSIKKGHCSLPVPIVIFGAGKGGVNRFSERACRKGSLGKIKSIDLLGEVLLKLRSR